MPTLRGWSLTGAGVALVFLWYALGEAELLLTGSFFLIAQTIAVLLVKVSRPQIEVTRRIGSSVVHDGDTTTIKLLITNTGKRSATNLIIDDDVNRLGVATFEVAKIGKEITTTATYRVTCRPRGVYRIGPARVRKSDPLGLAETTTSVGPVDRIVVYPAIEQLSGLPIVRGQDPSMQVSRPEHARRGGEDFYTLREYQLGDDLRRVHWPSSAKTDSLMIRQLETPSQSRALALLDIRAGAYPSSPSFERAVSGAATIVTHLVRSGFDADLWAGDADPIDASRYASAMQRLALVVPDPAVDIRSVASRIRQKGGGGALVIVTGGADQPLLNAQQLLSRGYPTTVLVTVAPIEPEILADFQRLGVITISIPSDGSWAADWTAAMRSSWTTASVV